MILDNYFAELPEREGVHGQHRAGGEAARLRRRSSAVGVRSPNCRPTTSASVRWGSAWRKRACAGLRCRRVQTGDGRARPRSTAPASGPHVLTVHDELVLEVPLDEGAGRPLVRDVMESVCTLKVPLVVDLGFGPTWAEPSSSGQAVSEPGDAPSAPASLRRTPRRARRRRA